MTEQNLLRLIGESNKSFLAGTPRILDAGGAAFVVVSCMDSRLTDMLEPALGLPRQRAVVIRTAGNQLSERNRDALRSIALALYVKKVTEIIIVGHTDCSLAAFSAAEVAESFRQRGVPRTAFGDEDLRTWFGAFANIRDNVTMSIGYLRKSGIVPPGVKIHGLIMDSNKGSIEVVVDGYLASDTLPAVPSVAAPEKAPEILEKEKKEPAASPAPVAAPPPAPATPAEGPRKGPIVVGAPPSKADRAPAPPSSLIEAALILRDFFNRERQTQRMQKAVSDLKTIWRQEKSPLRILAEMEKTVQGYQAQYPNLPGALAYLENAIRTGSADKIGFSEIMRRILD